MRVPRPGGIPVHPMLVHFPLVAWTVATFASWGTLYDPTIGEIAIWTNVAGLAFALIAMATGFLEFLDLPGHERIQTVANRHIAFILIATSVYSLSLFLQYKLNWLAAAVTTTVGFGMILFGAHQGARLVYQFGIPGHYKESN